MDDRAPSPEAVLLKSSSTLENLGPSEDDDADFEKELAKMVTDNAESRKVDKKTALALWDQTVPPPVLRKKRAEDAEEGQLNAGSAQGPEVMKFTLFTKRGNKPQVSSSLINTLSATECTSCALDARARNSCRIHPSCPDENGPDAGQGGATAAQAPRARLRAARRSRGVAR